MSGAPREVGWLRFARGGSLVAANPAAARLFGFASPDELVAAAARRPLMPAVRSSGAGPTLIEVACRRADDSSWTCCLVVLPRRGAGGELLEVEALLLEDVAGRAESEAQRARELLESVINGLPNPVFVKDEQHRWVIVNDSACRLWGYSREELIGKSDYDYFPKVEADVFWAKDNIVFSGGGTDENEERLTDATGRTHVILTRKTLHTEPSGRHLLLGVITDISERKQMEEELARSRDELDRRVAERTSALREANRRLTADIAERERVEQRLRESEERFRSLADSMAQIVWIGGPDGATESVNVKWTEYTGLPPEAALDGGWATEVHPSDRSACMQEMHRAVETGTIYEVEYRLRRRDGVYHWHLCRALPFRDADGKVVRWIGTATDIEDQKHQQEILKDEDRRKNEFIALLGHELRNPLNPIRIAVSLMRRIGTEDPMLRRAQEIIDRQVTQMTRLIDDLLDVSRITRGKILLRKERIDLVDLVRTALGDRCESLAAHDLSLDASLPSSPLFVDADPVRIAQAVGNLLDNAEKFTDPGGRIAVTLERDADGRCAAITVRDTGIGMKRETMERLFEPFVQGERSLASGRGGLGLGLSLVRGLIDLHQGTVTAASEGEGRGSTFTIRLPLPEQQSAKDHAQAPTPSPRSAHRILVIEDNPDAAEVLEMALSTAGHEVLVASTGEEGIARARTFHPRVVLSDIGLPGMSGYDVARALREDRALASTHLVAITGYGQEDDQRQARSAGFDAHLTKPFDMNALERILAGVPRDEAV